MDVKRKEEERRRRTCLVFPPQHLASVACFLVQTLKHNITFRKAGTMKYLIIKSWEAASFDPPFCHQAQRRRRVEVFSCSERVHTIVKVNKNIGSGCCVHNL